MNEKIITGEQYFKLLKEVKNVCIEAGFEIFQPAMLDILTDRSILIHQFSDSVLDAKLVAQNMASFCNSNIVCFEASERVEIDFLSDYFLKAWAVEFDLATEPFLRESTLETNSEVIEILLTSEITRLPNFKNLKAVEERLYKAFTSYLKIEIIYRKIHRDEELTEVPNPLWPVLCLFDYPKHFFGTTCIINRYRHLVKQIETNTWNAFSITDSVASEILERFTHMTRVSFAGCLNLTHAAFKRGHPTLKSINISNTNLSEDYFKNFYLFPSLEEIKKNL